MYNYFGRADDHYVVWQSRTVAILQSGFARGCPVHRWSGAAPQPPGCPNNVLPDRKEYFMLSTLLEFGGAVYLVVMGSLVAGLLRSAKAGSRQRHQATDGVRENRSQAQPQAEA
jgi:hypothetical protein